MIRRRGRDLERADPAVAAALAAGLCLVRVGRPSYWYDEAATLGSIGRPLPGLLRELGRVDAVYGLYYLLVKAWCAVLGTGEVGLRSLSAGLVGLAAGLLHLLVRRLGGDRPVAWMAVALLLLIPRVTWAGGEGRVFALSIAAGCLLVLAAAGYLARPSPGRWTAVALATAGGITAFLYVALLIPVMVLAHLLRPWPAATREAAASRRGAGPLAAAMLAGVALASPFVLLVLSQRAQLARVPPLSRGTVESVLGSQWFMLPLSPPTAHLDRTWWLPCGVALAVLVLVLAVVGAATRSRLAVLGLLWAGLPVAAVLLSSAVLQPTYTSRYWGFCAPGLGRVSQIPAKRHRSVSAQRHERACRIP